MHRQLSRVMDIQTGVVLGDMERARSAGAWIATREEQAGFSATTDAHQAEIRGYAALIAQSRDPSTVADRVGHLGAACGSCHQETGGGPHFVVAGPPTVGTTQAGTMVLHLWAADRMWDGLIGPSTDAWMAGTAALSQAWQQAGPAFFAAEGTGFLGEAQIHRIAEAAEGATTQEDRAAIYGELLSTCNGCHRSGSPLAAR
jgi:cytochrome c556